MMVKKNPIFKQLMTTINVLICNISVFCYVKQKIEILLLKKAIYHFPAPPPPLPVPPVFRPL